MLTAYSTKGELADERTDAAVKAFFSEHFGHFVGKHTSWLLLDEPCSSQMTPQILNNVKNNLLHIYKTEISKNEENV